MFEDMLRAYVIDFSGIWDSNLPFAEFSYKKTIIPVVVCRYLKFFMGESVVPQFVGGRSVTGTGLWEKMR